MSIQWERGDFTISTDPARIQLDVVHGYLRNAYWCKGISIDVVRDSISHSLPFGLYKEETQIGFARVISDFSTIAYLGDLFIIDNYQGAGLGKWLTESIMAHPDLQGLRRWILLTLDAHGLYEQYGFTKIKSPERWMERWDSKVYEH